MGVTASSRVKEAARRRTRKRWEARSWSWGDNAARRRRAHRHQFRPLHSFADRCLPRSCSAHVRCWAPAAEKGSNRRSVRNSAAFGVAGRGRDLPGAYEPEHVARPYPERVARRACPYLGRVARPPCSYGPLGGERSDRRWHS